MRVARGPGVSGNRHNFVPMFIEFEPVKGECGCFLSHCLSCILLRQLCKYCSFQCSK